MDKELFELCKEVYKLTDWADTDGYCYLFEGKLFTSFESGWYDNRIIGDLEEYITPLYTSDYLLEKLKPLARRKWSNGLKGYELTIFYDEDEDNWSARFKSTDKDDNKYFGDKPVGGVYGFARFWENGATPLKALLKLVLALKESGNLS